MSLLSCAKEDDQPSPQSSSSSSSNSVQCSANTQDGTRCERKTTNAVGLCWQHK